MRDTLSNCIRKKTTSYTPIWFMRQAGRYLPEFREIRKANPNFIKLCLNPDLVKEITLQPIKRFDIDAAIIFSDILMIPYGLGQKVEFKKGFGPQLENINLDKIINTDQVNFVQKLLPVYKGIEKVRNNLEEKNLIGFVGAPWTLLLYMLNKESPKKSFNFDKINKDKFFVSKLLKKIEEIICLHIVEHVKSKKIPVICFPKGIGKNYVEFCSTVKPDCISIDYEVDPKWIKEKINGIPIQGGLDPKILLGDKEEIKKRVLEYLNIFKDYPYIFNLGHGVLPETKPEIVEYLIKIIREKK